MERIEILKPCSFDPTAIDEHDFQCTDNVFNTRPYGTLSPVGAEDSLAQPQSGTAIPGYGGFAILGGPSALVLWLPDPLTGY